VKARVIIPKQMRRMLYQALPDLWLQNISGEVPWDKQREIMEAVVCHPRVAVASANGCGKTFIAARIAASWLLTYRPSIVITTAPTDRQVNDYLMARDTRLRGQGSRQRTAAGRKAAAHAEVGLRRESLRAWILHQG
jgi:superfamily II DNA or RNA helicase